MEVPHDRVWWVTEWSVFDSPVNHEKVRTSTYKSQTWFEARANLGGNPKRVVSEHHIEMIGESWADWAEKKLIAEMEESKKRRKKKKK